MEKHIIKYGDREIEISQPTIGMWKKLISIKNILEEDTFGVKLLSAVTDIPEEEILQQDWYNIYSVVENLSKYYLELDTKFYDEFEFKGTTYKFTNLPSMSFGQYIDIQTFYNQPEHYRTNNINRLMALLYLPKGEKYNTDSIQKRSELFNDLDVRYMMGASLFFSLLITSLKETTKISWVVKMKKLKIAEMVYRLVTGGISRCLSWLITTLQKWNRYQNSH